MADYRSTLTGTQMDSALLDMAEHNSEAYAVGERNGIAVAPDDVTYHNNARYYAQIASSQIVGDASSAVRWDTDQSEALTSAQKAVARNNINAASDSDVVKITSQTLTSAEQEQARANIMAGGSNPNLLDNPWFTVNQRNVAVGTNINGNGFVADRWQATGTTGATRNSDGSLTITDTLFHKLPPALELDGKTVTLSVLYADGTTEANTFPWSGTVTKYFTYGRAVVYASAYQINFNSFTKNVKAFKLELGSVSTLANDVPPDYEQTLNDCQYRCVVYDSMPANFLFCRGVATTATNLRAVIDLPRSMANDKVPTVTMTGSLTTPQGNTITAIASASTVVRGNKLVVNCTTSGLTGGNTYDISTGNGGQTITISADL